MAGFDYSAGRSNNMVAAESRGMITIGRWAKRHGVSAAAAVAVIRPHEAHHTGTGRRGTSRLTPVVDSATEPTAAQLSAMVEHDRLSAQSRTIGGCRVRWLSWPTSRTARRLPSDHLELRGVDVVIDGHGRVERWERQSGVVIVGPDGAVVFENIDGRYDDLAAIVRRLTAPAAPAVAPASRPVPAAPAAPARESRPLTEAERASLAALDLAALAPLSRKARKATLYAAGLPNRAEALDALAELIAAAK